MDGDFTEVGRVRAPPVWEGLQDGGPMLSTGYAESVSTATTHKRVPAPYAQRRAHQAPPRGGTNGVLEFVVEPLASAALVRPEHEPDVLFLRLTGSRAPASRIMAVLPNAGDAVKGALAHGGVHRGVIVGADAIFFADENAHGRHHAIDAFVDVVRAFTDANIPFVWRTRAGIDGTLLPAIAHVLAAAGRLATVEMGIATMDDHDARALEGDRAALADDRLRLASALSARGIVVRALVDPLVPMLTDQTGPLEALITALADAGVKKLGARYITLTRERAKVIAARLAGMQKALLQGVFADEPWQKADEETGPRELHKRIPPSLRRRGHERLIEVGSRHGVIVEILDPVDDGELARSLERAERPDHTDRRPGEKRLRPQLDLFAVAKRKPR